MENRYEKDTKAAKPLIMQKLNIKMENDKLKIKNELKKETRNHLNETNVFFCRQPSAVSGQWFLF
jgi:hypothetical protein